jgi:hypothetical protein
MAVAVVGISGALIIAVLLGGERHSRRPRLPRGVAAATAALALGALPPGAASAFDPWRYAFKAADLPHHKSTSQMRRTIPRGSRRCGSIVQLFLGHGSGTGTHGRPIVLSAQFAFCRTTEDAHQALQRALSSNVGTCRRLSLPAVEQATDCNERLAEVQTIVVQIRTRLVAMTTETTRGGLSHRQMRHLAGVAAQRLRRR